MFDDTGGSFGGKKQGRTDDLELCRQMRVAPSFPLLQSWSQSGQTLLNGRGRGKNENPGPGISFATFWQIYIFFSTFKVGHDFIVRKLRWGESYNRPTDTAAAMTAAGLLGVDWHGPPFSHQSRSEIVTSLTAIYNYSNPFGILVDFSPFTKIWNLRVAN
jgi:hypothetical protein